MRIDVSLAVLLLGSAFQQPVLPPNEGVPATVSYNLDRSGTPLSTFTLTMHTDGSATYAVSIPPEVPRYSPYAATLAAQPNTQLSTAFTLPPATTMILFQRIQSAAGNHTRCASKLKNIAKTGVKTLTYNPAGAPGWSCTYDYTDEKNIAALNATFQGLAVTLDEGRKLEQKHRFDRLALDPEIQFLADALKNGQAVEVGIIAPALHSLIDDPEVLERVRVRATSLLEQADLRR